jgi:molybdenum cofactor cytidylyltransferase
LIAGLILAAGEGQRFGPQPKLLANLGGRPLLEHAIRAQCAVSELQRVVVVLGARAQQIAAAVDFGRAEAVVCDQWARGQSASLRCGLSQLSGTQKVIVTLGDQPLISPGAICRLLPEPGGSRAIYRGAPGHPVVLGPQQIAAAGGLRGDHGAGGLLAGGRRIECSDLCCGSDVDTPAQLHAISRAWETAAPAPAPCRRAGPARRAGSR